MTSTALKTVEQRLLWLSHWMIHQANHLRPKEDAIKVGGHQASSASLVSIMTALYFGASTRRQGRGQTMPRRCFTLCTTWLALWSAGAERFRGYGGVQSCPVALKMPLRWTFQPGR